MVSVTAVGVGVNPILAKYSDQLDGRDDLDKPDRSGHGQDRRRGELMTNPMYRQIAEDLREQIESGKLKPGQQLQTELELRERYDASRNTVRDAIKWLMNLDLVETRPGQGTFVVQKIAPYITTLSGDPWAGEGAAYPFQVSKQGRTPSTTDPQVEMQRAGSGIADELLLEEGAPVISRHLKRFIDETPWSLETSFFPQGFVLRGADKLLLADDIKEGAVQYLNATLGLRQVGYRDWITVRAPNTTEADFFRLPPDGRVAVFENFRTAFDQTGTPMRVTVTVFPIDRNQFIIEIGDVPEPRVPQSPKDHKS
jgi:GntR family transcriptional regulator